MKILITGATGLVGQSLCRSLQHDGHQLIVLTRNISRARLQLSIDAEFIEFDLSKQAFIFTEYPNIDAIINLAGESIDGSWTVKKKNKILSSRFINSQNLLINCPDTVSTVMSASAVGYYGDSGDTVLTENSPNGTDFLAVVCKKWEEIILKNDLKNDHCRTIILRFGVVLSKRSGALKKMAKIFNMNLGAPIGSGEQWMSFISLEDSVSIIKESLINKKYEGVINVVTPCPMKNKEFSLALSKKLNKFCLPRIPQFLIELVMGEMSQLILNSNRVMPSKLKTLGYVYKHETLNEILDSEF